MPKPASKLPITEVSPAPELEKRTRRVFSPEYKLKILAEAEAEAERCAWAAARTPPMPHRLLVLAEPS